MVTVKSITKYKNSLVDINLQGCFPLNCRNISATLFILYFLMFFYFIRKLFLFCSQSHNCGASKVPETIKNNQECILQPGEWYVQNADE